MSASLPGPGHPTVIAALIVERYPSLEAVERDLEKDLPLRDIPGSDRTIQAAVDLLRGLLAGDNTALAKSNAEWDGACQDLDSMRFFPRGHGAS